MARPDGVERSLAQWAETEDSVRGLTLVGSRASSTQSVDALCDYDVMLFLGHASTLLESDAWLERFGPILVMLHERYDLLGHTVPTRLVQYQNGVRIDFSLCSLDLLEQITDGRPLPELLDGGYRVFVDKDGRLSRLPPPTGRGHRVEPPSEEEYGRVVNEFWWESLYVAKNLARGELLPARYSGERVLRFECLLPMLEWYAQCRSDGEARLGPHGRGLTRFLGKEDRRLLDRTYMGAAMTDNWEALFALASLFERAARRVGEELGYAYPTALGQGVHDFLRQVQAGAPC